MNQARPMPAATAQAQSETPAIRTEAAHIAASCGPAGSLESMNCGRKAVKKTIVFGLDSATIRPRRKRARPVSFKRSPSSPACRHIYTPSHTR